MATGIIKINGPDVPGAGRVISLEALSFMAGVDAKFGERRRVLLQDRIALQKKLDENPVLDFLPETAAIRNGNWTVRPAPADLQNRCVEITGPVDRKMVINALNSGANGYMADFEDSSTPTWENLINGQINLLDANTQSINFFDRTKGKEYRLNNKVAVLMVRPRGLHMEEKHVTVDGKTISAAFFDFAIYLFNNQGKPYFYLPKIESYHEAQLWSDVISYAEDALKLPRGTVRVTVLIETITAAFQMDEILHALRDHIVGLNCGRWDYIFSFIKKFSHHPAFILPNRASVTMLSHFMRSYSLLLIKTCHRRKAHAMGGMAAQIPIKDDDAANDIAMENFSIDKAREANNGHDGTWVAHPALVARAQEVFGFSMKGANQLDRLREDVNVTAKDLLTVPTGEITEEGVRRNINIGLLYLRAWLSGTGCVPLHNMMEDAATAEISRTQLWQWRRHNAKMADGRVIDDALMQSFIQEEIAKLEQDRYMQDAVKLFTELVMSPVLEEFLTTKAYDLVLAYEKET